MFESDDGCDFISDTKEFDCVFVVSEFKGEVFRKLHEADVRIVGPPVVIKCARDNQVTKKGHFHTKVLI